MGREYEDNERKKGLYFLKRTEKVNGRQCDCAHIQLRLRYINVLMQETNLAKTLCNMQKGKELEIALGTVGTVDQGRE